MTGEGIRLAASRRFRENKAKTAYPAEQLIDLFQEREKSGVLDAPTGVKARKPATHLPVLFKHLFSDRDPLVQNGKLAVDRPTFKRQFSALTCNLFDDWKPEDYTNLLVAGGAVLACVLPVEQGYQHLMPPLTAQKWFQHDFMPLRRSSKDKRTFQELMQDCRCPSGDIDIFVYGLDQTKANARLVQVMVRLKERIRETVGDSVDAVFIKSDNTVTLESGSPRRKIQIITRLYESKEEILNEFDIDCICVGFDGKDVLATGRALKAISTRINTVDLSIRGENYENRLLKYAERGFAIAVPGLDVSKLDRDHTKLKRRTVNYRGEPEDAYESESWEFWAQSRNLLRLCLGEYIAQTERYIETPFPGRMHGRSRNGNDDSIESWSIRTNSVEDNYSPSVRGKRTWPASMRPTVFAASKGTFAIAWKRGSMERKPLEFGEWSCEAMVGIDRPPAKLSWQDRLEESRKKAADKDGATRGAATPASVTPTPSSPASATASTTRAGTPEKLAPVVSPKVVAALKWIEAMGTNLPAMRMAPTESAAELMSRLHPTNALAVVGPSSATTDEPLLEKLIEIFQDARGVWQAGKKVAEGVFEGRLSDKARFFFFQLTSTPPSFLVSAISLNHKGINRLITHSVELAQSLSQKEDVKDELLDFSRAGTSETREVRDRQIADHASSTLTLMQTFREDAAKTGWFLPRLHLGSLEMIVELDGGGQAKPLMTDQELKAMRQALEQGCVLIVKGSAGNGKTTTFCEIANRSLSPVLLCLPTEKLLQQVVRPYPSIRATTARERLDEIWPKDWLKVTFAEFAEAKRAKLEAEATAAASAKAKGRQAPKSAAITFDANEAWEKRTSDPFYFEFKQTTGRKDESDLFEHLVNQFRSNPVPENLQAHFVHTLVEEAQSMTPTELRILALSSGFPEHVLIGMHSKQAVGRDSAGRRAAVNSAIFAALQARGGFQPEKMTTQTIALTVYFRCPVGVLRVLRTVIERWLKPFKDFDDFSVDSVVRSSLWDSPPVYLASNPATAKKLLAKLAIPVVILKPDGPHVLPRDLEQAGTLSLSLTDCRGLEFDELLLLANPLSTLPAKVFKEAVAGVHSESWRKGTEADKIKDVLCQLIVMLTRARFGVVWVEKDLHHPLLDDLRAEQCVKVLGTDADIADAAASLSRARKDAMPDETASTGSRSLLSTFGRLVELLTDRVESYQPIESQATEAAKMATRLMDDTEIRGKVASAFKVLPEAVLSAQLLKAPDDKAIGAIRYLGEILGSAFLQAVESMDPQPPSEQYSKLLKGCIDLAYKLGKSGTAKRLAGRMV